MHKNFGKSANTRAHLQANKRVINAIKLYECCCLLFNSLCALHTN